MLATLGIEPPDSWGLLFGVCLAGGATIALTIRVLQLRNTAIKQSNPVVQAPAAPPSDAKARWPEATLPVLAFDALIAQTGTATHLDRARQDCGLNEGTWSDFILPVVRNVAELVQLLPASESHHHAQPGGLWIHTCETLRHAVRLRQGIVLPTGRDAEDQSKHRHRWTAGIIIAALLHDVGKTVRDLQVRLYGHNHRGNAWNALAGDMRASQATDYAVDFPRSSERDYKAHQREGVLLMQRLVPSSTLVWIGQDPPLLEALMQYLAGEAHGTDNPIASLVSNAEKESVRTNLLEGPRTRFSTARAVPLIERLMDGLRRMLAEGGSLPLNRPGAAGYVSEGDIWFAAARLANGVREYLKINESSVGIPGEDKNDRLFDVWQDYGACRTNPATGRALWGGRVDFSGGSAGYDLPSMLRFPLDRLYPDPGQYPAELAGRIVPIVPLEQTAPAQKVVDTASTPSLTNPPETVLQDAEVIPFPSPQPIPSPAPVIQPVVAPPSFAETLAQVDQPSTAPAPTVESGVDRKASKELLDAQDMATRADFADPPKAGKSAPSLQPVAPAMRLPALPGKSAKAYAGPSPEALEFMTWVQQGIADASLTYNLPDALVHFVRHKDENGMLLVSPLIFRRFAEVKGAGTEAGLAIQRAFSAAGWHVRGAAGKNVVSYQVMRKGERGGNLLNGFLVLQPERFFNPVPQTNDRLVFWNTDPALAPKDKK